ncbi:outer membrane protein [Citreimonas sp.]|uniref:outer membrane protein n=1 Tax=Citreimonas sp. TaxID=3036715 RepID=UPI0040588A64
MLVRITLVSLAAASSAFADGPSAVAPVMAPTAVSMTENTIDWSGSYGGLTVGGATLEGEAERSGYSGPLLTLDVENGLFPGRIDDPSHAGIAGLRYGRNGQRGDWVTGFEIDVAFAEVTADAEFSRIDPNPAAPFTGVDTITGYRTELDSFASARLRAGYATGPSLLYLTGGIAVADVSNTFSLDLPNLGAPLSPYSNAWTEEGVRFGYVLGAGFERKVMERVSLSADVVRFDLEDVDILASDSTIFGGDEISYEFTNAGYLARLGINFAF